MASYRRRGKTWTAYWYESDPATGKRKQKSKGGFRTRGDAVAWNTRQEADRLRGFVGAPEKMTVSQLVRDYIESRPIGSIRAVSLYHYRKYMDRYVDPYIGSLPAAQLTRQHVQRWHRDLLERPLQKGQGVGLAPTTIQRVHALLSSAYRDAVEEGVILRNPFSRTTPPKGRRRPRTRLSDDETRRLLAAADDDDRWGLLVRLALFTLLRPGELLVLRWSDIDTAHRLLFVRRTRTMDEHGRYVIGDEAKTRGSHRSIALTDDMLARLRAHRIRQNEHRLAYAELWHEHDLVFCRDDGRMIAQSTHTVALTRLCERAGVPRVTPHELRGTGATLMILNNEHLKVISERLGHRSINTTADHYLDVSEGMQREASERLERLFRGA